MLIHHPSPAARNGVTAVAITNPEALPPGVIRLVIEEDIIQGSQHLGLGYPEKKASSLWAGPAEELRPLRQLYRDEFYHKRPAVSVISMGESEGNWFHGLGYHAVTKHLDGEIGLFTLFYESRGLSPVESANLGKLREMTKAQGCHVVIFIIASEKFDPTTLKGMVDRLIVIEPCEADQGWEYAASITQIRQLYFSPSPGKLFCQFNQVPDAFPEVTWEPFIDTDPEIRAQWHMHQKECSMAEIAQAFGCDKSTVSRNLKHTPKKLDSWLSDDQVESRFDLSLEDEATQPKTTKAKTGGKVEAIEDDDDCGWDDPDEDDAEDEVPKQQPKRKKMRF